MSKKYNIIGDIHGRVSWKELVVDDAINIFVGDYFSPYHSMSFEEQLNNFLDIIEYKNSHPETILLIGNHDDQHWKNIDMRVSRFDYQNYKQIKEVFEEFSDYLQVCYSIENKILVSHAGVSIKWYINQKLNCFNSNLYVLDRKEDEKFDTIEDTINNLVEETKEVLPDYNFKLEEGDVYLWKNNFYYIQKGKIKLFNESINKISKNINNFWLSPNKFKNFKFSENVCMFSDSYGTSKTHGPLWIRPQTLVDVNILLGKEDKYQIVGHTMFKEVSFFDNLIMTDCLEYKKESLLINFKNNKFNFERNNGEEKSK